MNIKFISMYVCMVILLLGSQILDVLGYKFRCNKNKLSWTNSTAIAGILFYMSRLCFMLYVMIIAMMHEVLKIDIVILDELSIVGMILMIAYLYLMRRNNFLVKIVLITIEKFNIFKQKNIHINMDHENKKIMMDKKLFTYSFLVSFFVIFCGLFPVNLIKIFPNAGMSLVYISNALSAIAGLSWHVLQEPKIVDNLNLGNFDECYKSLVAGKVISLIATSLILIVFIQYVN
jgi:hypothetical protein